MRHIVLLVGVVCVVATATGYLLAQEQKKEPLRKGLEWLLTYPEDYRNQGVYWALTDINLRFCKSPQLEEKIKSRFNSTLRSESEQAFFNFASTRIIPEGVITDATGRYDRWLLEALACKAREISEETRKEIFAIDTARGYDATHKYLALSYMDRLECLSSEEKKVLDTLATSMVEEEKEGFSDISSERAAFLLWSGRKELVSDAWIHKIQSAQESTGGWAESGQGVPNPHTSALALWSLVQASGTCPL